MLSLIKDGNLSSPYPEIYGAYMNLQRMVRTENYKLIVYPRAKKMLLFNVAEDPEEMNDLADNPEFKTIKSKMINRLKKQQKSMNDPLDLHSFLPESF